jgi:hypothetical protein
MLPGISEKNVLPTTEYFEERLPLRDMSPTGRAFTGLGTLSGGAGVATGAKAASRGAQALAPAAGALAMRAAELSGAPVYGMGVIKPKGGNWLAGSVEGLTRDLKKANIPDPELLRMHQELGLGVDEPALAANDALRKWVDQKLGSYVKNEMATPQDPVRLMLEEWPAKRDAQLAVKQAKIDRLLAKRETADPRAYPMIDRDIDEVRSEMTALSKKSVIHLPTGDLEQGTGWMPESLATSRMRAGFPVHGVAESPAAKGWEASADAFINAAPASEHTRPLTASEIRRGLGSTVDDNPWLLKVPPETPVYYPEFGKFGDADMGFPHVLDELRNAVNPASGLPENLLWKYQDLDKVTVPQALQRVGEINDWRAAQKFAEDQARANNAATVLHKDFPDSSYKWVELAPSKEPKTYTAESLPSGFELTKDRDGYYQVLNRNVGEAPTTDSFSRDPEQAISKFNNWVKSANRDFDLERALKYEGETMGHCVGGYCPDVMSGKSRIFSLRNKNTGEPHVTVETRPGLKIDRDPMEFAQWLESPEGAKLLEKHPTAVEDFMIGEEEGLRSVAPELFTKPSDIVQIKGKGNLKPKEDYLPYVQDFVKSDQWGKVGDLQNTGLLQIHPEGGYGRRGSAEHGGVDPGFYTQKELDEAMKSKLGEGFAEGGLVGHTEYSPLDVDYIIGNVMSGQHEPKYGKGGEVDVPDLEFEDSESARLYKHAMKMGAGPTEVNTFGTGINKGGFNLGVDVARVNPESSDRLMNSLMANYGVKMGDVGVNANVRKPLDAEGVYIGMLNGTIPVGKGMAMLGVQAVKTPEGREVTGYNAGWSGEVGPGRLNVNVMQPKGHPSNRAAQVQYQVPFAEGGIVESNHIPYDEAKISSLVNALREELNA